MYYNNIIQSSSLGADKINSKKNIRNIAYDLNYWGIIIVLGAGGPMFVDLMDHAICIPIYPSTPPQRYFLFFFCYFTLCINIIQIALFISNPKNLTFARTSKMWGTHEH
jgi:hypothetical protein